MNPLLIGKLYSILFLILMCIWLFIVIKILINFLTRFKGEEGINSSDINVSKTTILLDEITPKFMKQFMLPKLEHIYYYDSLEKVKSCDLSKEELTKLYNYVRLLLDSKVSSISNNILLYTTWLTIVLFWFQVYINSDRIDFSQYFFHSLATIFTILLILIYVINNNFLLFKYNHILKVLKNFI